jgi:tRNA(Ile)-lysidine synthetase-like protein
VLVAVSGGADSTALLLTLKRLAPELGVELCAAHLHHGLRGVAADQDLEFVRALCAHLEVPLECARWDTRARMKRRGLKGQAGLRTLRREYLERSADRWHAAAIATAHTADDQLETVLLRLMRGAGLPGLGGMSPRRGRWIKPLLGATRFEIEADLEAAGAAWREDASNRDSRHARSRVRHEVIPALVRAMGQGRSDTLGARGALARRVARGVAEVRSARRLTERMARRLLLASADRGPLGPPAREDPVRLAGPPGRISPVQLPRPARPAEIRLDSRRLGSYPYVVKRTLFRLLWKRLGRAQPGLTHRHLDALARVVRSSRGGSRLDLPGGWVAELDRGVLVFHRDGKPGSEGPEPGRRRLAVPGARRWNGAVVRARWLSGAIARRRLRSKPVADECFASEAVEGELELRAAGSDEWFVPFGRPRGQRLGEFLRRQRVARTRRARPWVLADQAGILWVIGVRRSARAPLTPQTRKALWVHAEFRD